ncbi:MAG: hypothetical protein E7508_03965 [Ruminococcus sp.]|nr:hypothetical protein [Ruminococcus sp.]
MPVITIKSIEMTKEQREIIADTFINKLSEVTLVPKDRIYLFFEGHKLDEVACGGVLFEEKPPKTARGEFNKDKWNPKEDLKDIDYPSKNVNKED